MKREEKHRLKARELQQKLVDEAYQENFGHMESNYMIQPVEATLMKGRMTLTQDTIFENLQEAFQKAYKKQIKDRLKKNKSQPSLWEKLTPMEPIKVYFNELGVRPDCYDEVHTAALAMGSKVVDVEGVNEYGDKVIHYMPIFSKVSVPVIKFDEVNRSEDADTTPYKNKQRRRGYIEFTVNPEIGSTYFEITKEYTKFLPGTGKKCKCYHSPKMYRYSAMWRDFGGRGEFDYISFRRLLGLREVVPVHKEGGTVYEEVDSIYPDFGEVRRFVLDKTQKEVKELADKNELDCYFTYELVMPIKANGKRATRGNPEKIVFHVHLSELGKRMQSYNNRQQMIIRMEQMLMTEFRMSKQSATSLTARVSEENRLKFSNKIMELLTYMADPKNGVKDRGGYAYMALSNYLDEITPRVIDITPEKKPTQENNPMPEKVQVGEEDLEFVGENSGNEESVGLYSEEALPIWWKVLDFIRERMEQQQFEIHIEPLYPISFGNGELTIAAPNEYIYKEVQTKYAARLLEIIRERFGGEAVVKYVLDNRMAEQLIARYKEHCRRS